MGSSREWAADMENELTTCIYGYTTKYFDQCDCPNCVYDRAKSAKARTLANTIAYDILDTLMNTEECDWHKIKSFKVNIKKDRK